MKERRDRYRAALDRGRESAARPSKVTMLRTRYVSVTIEVDPDLHKGLTRWAGQPLSVLMLTGTGVLRAVADAAPRVPFFPGGARRS